MHEDPKITGASEVAEQAFVKQYPAIYKHLSKFKKELSNRNKAETGIRYEWYALQRWGANYWSDFFKQVIAWQRITAKNQFYLTKKGYVILDSMAFISNIEKYKYYLLAILNSNLVYFWIKKNVHEYGSSGFRLSNQYVEQIPVPLLSEIEQGKFNELVEKILQENEDTNYLEKQIDKMIYKLYELTPEEIEFIESI